MTSDRICINVDETSRRISLGLMLELFTGLRIDELLTLRWSDIDINEGVLYHSCPACRFALELYLFV